MTGESDRVDEARTATRTVLRQLDERGPDGAPVDAHGRQQRWIASLPERLQGWLGGRAVDEVECMVSDLAGISRGKAMPAKKFAEIDSVFLPISIFYQTITGAYAEFDSATAFAETDVVMRPIMASARAVPWATDVTVQVICDLEKQDGTPLGLAPRNVLKRVLGLYAAHGWQPVVAPELEFYLTKRNIDPDYPIEPTIGRTGRAGAARQAYSISAVDEYGKIVDDIYDFAEDQGLEIDTVMQENGSGQLEINLNHGDPLELADQVFLFKRTIRETALRHDCYATFMAKPMEDQPGSAMHIHQSVWDIESGQNIFSQPDGSQSQAFLHFIGGQQRYLDAAMCILAPYVNSYRRLIPDNSAPINLEWGPDNRTTGLRVPVSPPTARRVEARVVGMDTNPYLAMAACLACGYLGMTQRIDAREPLVNAVGYNKPHALPRGLLEALSLFNACDNLKQVLGEDFASIYQRVKNHEMDEYLRVISPWEREHLMLNV
ncbi:MAG: glutamine synthetase family protein [Pseudomonadota bacterium]